MPSPRKSFVAFAVLAVAAQLATLRADSPAAKPAKSAPAEAANAIGPLPNPVPRQIQFLRSNRIVLNYRAAKGSGAITRVEAWVTADRSQTWQQVKLTNGATNDRVNYDAPQDGLYGFYLILFNAAGPSSTPPEPGTAPQQWVMVDRAAPSVQVLEIRPDAHFNQNREVKIRWKASDDNLIDRPVGLYHRGGAAKSFQSIAELLEARGEFRWTVPPGMTGAVPIKITAVDRAGNSGENTIDSLNIPAEPLPLVAAAPPAEQPKPVASAAPVAAPVAAPTASPKADVGPLAMKSDSTYGEPAATPVAPPPPTVSEARKRYDAGTWHRRRGENAIAMLKFREALQLEPNFIEARNDLAGLLVLAGSNDAAEQEYKKVLDEDPKYRPALKSLGLVQAAKKNYRSAADTLKKLLSVDPQDSEAWLYLGDVTLFMGDPPAARQHWNKALAGKTAAADVKEKARKRLAIYPSEAIAAGGLGEP